MYTRYQILTGKSVSLPTYQDLDTI